VYLARSEVRRQFCGVQTTTDGVFADGQSQLVADVFVRCVVVELRRTDDRCILER
jgi:hypothetical protein